MDMFLGGQLMASGFWGFGFFLVSFDQQPIHVLTPSPGQQGIRGP